MTDASGGIHPLRRSGQIAWGAVGGLTPYVVAGLNAVGYQTDFPVPTLSWGFVLALALSVGLGVIGSILLESHTPFAAWYHGGSFRIMLNFLFSESLHQISQHALH
jgi:hypothetical protein